MSVAEHTRYVSVAEHTRYVSVAEQNDFNDINNKGSAVDRGGLTPVLLGGGKDRKSLD